MDDRIDLISENFEVGALPDRKPMMFYAIDVDGVTAMKAKDQQGATLEARRLQAQCPGAEIVIRFVSLTEQDYRIEEEKSRIEQWATVLYKPIPKRDSGVLIKRNKVHMRPRV